ncbi:hypothetical protein AVEN_258743-1 [Araneus ventricosus]|uniref:Uncharacterized protein n=1 Tax=Araneus ventricosus TaxID=182803 RepID=A0A4Y2D2F4_ARAVE|nr:hypothetical protein AVEN_258743-1 [Araneus ventricosus]
MRDMRATRQRIFLQRKPPWKGSEHNIQYSGVSSKRNFRLSPTNYGRINGTTVTLEGTSTPILPTVNTSPALWQRPEIMFATGRGPFPTYLKRFSL